VSLFEQTAPARIVWHFERPTAWERWLATRLISAGGTEETFATALSPRPGRRVITPFAQRDTALAIPREIGAGIAADADSPCIALAPRGRFEAPGPVFGLTPDGPGDTSPPGWLTTSFAKQQYRGLTFEVPMAIGARVGRGAKSEAMVEIIAGKAPPSNLSKHFVTQPPEFGFMGFPGVSASCSHLIHEVPTSPGISSCPRGTSTAARTRRPRTRASAQRATA
jgi:hypothetical protein